MEAVIARRSGPARAIGLAALLMVLLLPGGAASAGEAAGTVLYATDFADGAEGWEAVNQASVSELARRPGGRSLRLRQYRSEEADSAWLGPVLKNPGRPVRVTLWAADNYIETKDFSFSAAFEVLPCKEDGTLLKQGGRWHFIAWDPERFMPQFKHTYTTAGLVWEFYEAVERPAAEYFRLRLSWPKTRMRGECYFTDVRITAVTEAALLREETPARPGAEPGGDHALEISTAATGNLFYHDDPLRFSFLLYNPEGPVAELEAPVLTYEITDYEHFGVAAGEIPFAAAAPLELSRRLLRRAPDRSRNLHLSAVLEEPAAREPGREFFLHARLLDGEALIAEDTITFSVVKPRRTDPAELPDARFISFDEGGGIENPESSHRHQAVIDKMGIRLTHAWDYSGWKRAQPEADGPIRIEKGPEYPKLVYCPNLEQVRGRRPNHPWGDVARMAPDWAVLDDPLNPGCKTFDIDGYVRYIVEYVRVNRHRVVQVVPSGLERRIDARTLELHRKAYAALKEAFPELPVGMMVWGILGEEGRQLILEEKLYEVADFFDTHVYLSAVDWTEWGKLQQALRKRGAPRRLISTEFARVGGTNQLQRARDVITSNLDAHAHDMYRVTNFLRYVGNGDPLPHAVRRGAFPGNGFEYMQYVDRPRIDPLLTGENWRPARGGRDSRGGTLMPMLQSVSYYNFVQNVECAAFRCVFRPSERSVAYVYERDGRTTAYLFLNEPAPPRTLALRGEVPYVVQDLYGRTDRVDPPGASLVVATLDPLALLFEERVPALHDAATAAEILAPAAGGVELPTVPRGGSATARVSLPPIFADVQALRMEATVDGVWPRIAAQTLPLSPQAGATAELPIAVSAGREPTSYTFSTRLYDGERLLSVLKQPLQISEVLSVQMRGVPMTRSQDPAVAVTLTSLADEERRGTVRLENRFFGAGYEPTPLEQTYVVGPRRSVELRFPLPREQVSLATSYVMAARLEDESGFVVEGRDDISFQACEKAPGPIAVDGNLEDWALEEILPIPFERWLRGPRDPDEFSGRFYTRWDDERLYIAAIITDSVPVLTKEGGLAWHDDNIMFGIYPWRWHMGEPLNTGYYREHLGPVKGGGAAFMRVGYVPSGPANPDDSEIAVTRTENGWIYEWAYPARDLYPLELTPGGGFRLSMSVWDQYQVPKKRWGKYSWLTFAGFNTSVHAQPDLWRQFTFVE